MQLARWGVHWPPKKCWRKRLELKASRSVHEQPTSERWLGSINSVNMRCLNREITEMKTVIPCSRRHKLDQN